MRVLKLYIEVTQTQQSGMNTGIPRAVRNILRNLLELAAQNPERVEVVPVVFRKGAFVAASPETVLKSHAEQEVRQRSGKLEPWQRVFRTAWNMRRALLDVLRLGPGRRVLHLIKAAPGDSHVMVLLDASWGYDIWPAIEKLKTHGVRIVSVIYDLIPITHSHAVVETLARAFERWLFGQMRLTDRIVCVSKSVAMVVEEYLEKRQRAGLLARKIPVSSFHLGAELDLVTRGGAVQEKILALRSVTSPIFLMVGTIEPRKNHRHVFDAFRSLWESGVDARLVIVGGHDWMSERLLSDMAAHAEAGRRLLVIRDASDEDLQWLYENSTALIMASEVEGFGLPIVEARQMRLPVICSDIPVFTELAAKNAEFFRLGDVVDLSRIIRSHVEGTNIKECGKEGWMTWRASADQLLRVVGAEGRAGIEEVEC